MMQLCRRRTNSHRISSEKRPGRHARGALVVGALLPFVPCSPALLAQPAEGGSATGAETRRFLPPSQLQRAPGAPSRAGLEKPAPGTRVSQELQQLYREFTRFASRGGDRSFVPQNPVLRVRDDRVAIDAVAAFDAQQLRAELEALGLKKAAVFGRMVGGLLPIASIPSMQELATLNFARAAMATTNSGLVTTQGDVATHADVARSTFGVDGTGITVGVLSDSFDCFGTEQAVDVASGDLPPGIVVLEEYLCASDEGRALAQIIHDTAPGAGIAFHTGFNSQADFATGIMELVNDASADVLVDDVIYYAEPMFQDGILAQAVDAVVASGVPYYTSAGNHGRDSYEGAFNASGMTVFSGEGHDFDPGPGVDLYQHITIPRLTLVTMVLQWDSPAFSVSGAPGSPNDLDLYLTDEPPTQILASGVESNVGGDPIEVLTFIEVGPQATYNIVIEGISGDVPSTIKYVIFDGGGTILEWQTDSSTITGHPNAAGAATVGAAAWHETPAFGQDPPLLEPFSSGGGTRILFDTSGNPINEVRQKPNFVSPDGVNTTFFGTDTPEDADTFPNFPGTSAAAPHAAGIAALLLQRAPSLSTADAYMVCESTALDMGPPGVDDDSGYGFCLADQALDALIFSDGFESGDTTAWSAASP